MRRILHDDDDDNDEETVGGAALASAQQVSAGAPAASAGASSSQDNGCENATSESENDIGKSSNPNVRLEALMSAVVLSLYDVLIEAACRPNADADPKGGCLGKGFSPCILSFDTLVKKLERRKSAWQRKPLDIDATIDQAMCPVATLSDSDAVIVEEDDDQAPTDSPVKEPIVQSQNTPGAVGAGLDHVDSCEKQDCYIQDDANASTEDDVPPPSRTPVMASTQAGAMLDQQPAHVYVRSDASKTVGNGLSDGGGIDCGVGSIGVADRSAEMETVALVQPKTAARYQDTSIPKISGSTTVREDVECDNRPFVDTSERSQLTEQRNAQDGTNDSLKHESRQLDSNSEPGALCESPEPFMTGCPPGDKLPQEDAGAHSDNAEESDVEREEDLHDLEDSDVESLQGGAVDEDDEEAMLEAAIAQERHAQQLLTAKRRRGNQFCDGEAEQSEDEAVSSDESDADDENGQLTMDEIADMVRELREKGLGEEEVAKAHAQWLEAEDEKALKELVSGIKRGFKKGRNRVGEHEEDWDVDQARERRRALIPQLENIAQIPQTREELLSQYKRKLAALERTLDSPVKPVAKAVHRREASAEMKMREHVVLPDIADVDDSPEAHSWAPLFHSQHLDATMMPQTRPESQSWDTVVRFSGPSLMGKDKKYSHAINIKAIPRSFMACTLGATASRAASGARAATEVEPSTTYSARQNGSQADFTKLREALGF